VIRTLIALLALCLTITAPVAVAQTVCDADVQRDGYIDGADLTVILASWGPCAACGGDISGDHFVDGVDLAIVLARWGGSCIPTISTVSPNNGPTSGGTAITIMGSGLQGTSSVLIGGTPATNVVVVSPTTVTAVTQPGPVGTTSVGVESMQWSVTVSDLFTYTPWYTILEQDPNPMVVTSAALRDAIIATRLPWRVRDNASDIEMLLVPPGSFDMGCIQGSNAFGCYGWEQPVHAVTLTNAFYIGRCEVTQSQWQAKMGSNPATFQESNGYPRSADRPVESVSWFTVQSFLDATGLRLPTEAEWEFACRAGTTTPFHSGPEFPNGTLDDRLVEQIAWYCGNHCALPMPVGVKAVNALGLYDMLGNVWEWCHDWYHDYTSAPQTNPTGARDGSSRVLRGGWAGNDSDIVRSSFRSGNAPDEPNGAVGFRVARNP
jgi:formylglycine-generating enzyme required for sulfatase activity